MPTLALRALLILEITTTLCSK